MAANDPNLLARAVRFVLAGGANTVLTFGLYLALTRVMAAGLAYTIAFLVGIAFACVVHGSWVFGGELTASNVARYSAWYLVVYGIGVAAVSVLDGFVGAAPFISGAIATCITAVLSFIGGYYVFASEEGKG